MTSTESGDMPTRDMSAESQESATTSAGHGEMPIKSMNEEPAAGEALAKEPGEQSPAIDHELAFYLQEQQANTATDDAGKHGEMPMKGME